MKKQKYNARMGVVSVCLVFIMLCCVFPTAEFAATADDNTSYHTVFSIESVTVRPGETVDIEISVAGDTEVSGMLLHTLVYDESSLEFIEFKSYGDLVTNSAAGASSVNGKNILLGYSPNIIPEGKICVVSFRIKDDAEDGDYKVSFATVGASDNGNEISSKLDDGIVTVARWLEGDFDNNGVVNMYDAVHFIGWVNFSYIPDLYPMIYDGDKDFNHDGQVDMYDAVYLIGWINFSYIPGLYEIDWYGKKAREYTVTFTDYDGAVLKTETVAKGESATPPDDPERVGYKFLDWDGDYTNIQQDTTITAVYEAYPYLAISSATASRGESDVTIIVSLDHNPGIIGLWFRLNYNDAVLTLNNSERGSALQSHEMTISGDGYKSGMSFIFDAVEASEEDGDNGDILVLTFSVAANTAPGDYEIGITCDLFDVLDNNVDPVEVLIYNGTVTVQ